MKTIYFVRHGNAKTSPKSNDSARPLSKTGIRITTALAKSLVKDGTGIDAIACSPAIRALETGYLIAGEFHYRNEEIVVSDLLYRNVSLDTYLKLIGGVDDKKNSLLIIGHNPELSKIVSQFLPGFALTIPSSGILAVTFDKNRWMDLKQGDAQFKFYRVSVKEGNLTAINKVLKKELEKRLKESMLAALKSMDDSILRKLDGEMNTATKIMTRKFFKSVNYLTVTDFSKIKEEPKPPKTKAKTADARKKGVEQRETNGTKQADVK
jgi:phosphohistidine phosphatase